MSIRTLVVANSGEVTQPINDVICTLPDFELLAHCRSSFEAMQWMEDSSPDLLMLDAELPGMDGFELLDALRPSAPDVIFFGNSPQHALRAFELEAIDLVSKPLYQALVRARQHLRKTAVEAELQISDAHRLLLRSGGRLVFVEPQEIRWIEANDNYVVFHTANERHTVRMTMNKIESILLWKMFIRIHRSTIVNVEQVREIRPLAHGDYAVVLKTGEELTLTRNYRRQVNELVPGWTV